MDYNMRHKSYDPLTPSKYKKDLRKKYSSKLESLTNPKISQSYSMTPTRLKPKYNRYKSGRHFSNLSNLKLRTLPKKDSKSSYKYHYSKKHFVTKTSKKPRFVTLPVLDSDSFYERDRRKMMKSKNRAR